MLTELQCQAGALALISPGLSLLDVFKYVESLIIGGKSL